VPEGLDPSRVVVAVHGIGRGAREQAELLAPRAEAAGALLVAPLFEEDRFPDYQRLGRQSRGDRADHALDRVLDDVAHALGIELGPLMLFGFSGGGQFVHRYALVYPHRVRKLVVAAPGWFTLPDPEQPFPLGTADCPDLPGVHFDLERFLRIPSLTVVGRHDTKRDASLRRSRSLDTTQGRNRVARARNWVEALRRAARTRGLDTRFRFRRLQHSAHDFVEAVHLDALDQLIFDFFWNDTPDSVQEAQTP